MILLEILGKIVMEVIFQGIIMGTWRLLEKGANKLADFFRK